MICKFECFFKRFFSAVRCNSYEHVVDGGVLRCKAAKKGSCSEIQRFPVFARYTYNIGSQNYYYEVLYLDLDNGKPETNKPIFFYAKTKDYNGNIHECRYYWWNEKLIKEIPADDPEMVPSAEDALNTAKMIFQIATMNNLWNY